MKPRFLMLATANISVYTPGAVQGMAWYRFEALFSPSTFPADRLQGSIAASVNLEDLARLRFLPNPLEKLILDEDKKQLLMNVVESFRSQSRQDSATYICMYVGCLEHGSQYQRRGTSFPPFSRPSRHRQKFGCSMFSKSPRWDINRPLFSVFPIGGGGPLMGLDILVTSRLCFCLRICDDDGNGRREWSCE